MGKILKTLAPFLLPGKDPLTSMISNKIDPSSSGEGSSATSAPAAATPAKMFTPDQIQSATKDYSTQALAKWNQIQSNMGAGGGSMGNINDAISSQATNLGTALGNVTTGQYGDINAAVRGLEPGLNAQYPLY